jgi:hypothetical protein
MRFVIGRLHLLLAMPPRFWAAIFVLLVTGCASGPPKLPYPAFIQSDDLEDVFMAALPGVRAKQFAGNPQTGRTSNRVNLPPGWKGTTGGTPGRSLEIYVLAGDLDIADISLGPGGYAHVPPGTFGFNMRSIDGAQVLYFLDDVDPLAMIRSPIILDSRIVDWQPTDISGISIKDLRSDPGNGARTWIMRIEPGAAIPWRSSSVVREGYLASGQYQHSECSAGEVHTAIYNRGGYFYRPAGAINGGSAAMAISEAVWLLRERTASVEEPHDACPGAPTS